MQLANWESWESSFVGSRVWKSPKRGSLILVMELRLTLGLDLTTISLLAYLTGKGMSRVLSHQAGLEHGGGVYGSDLIIFAGISEGGGSAVSEIGLVRLCL